MDGHQFVTLDGSTLVNRFTNDVHDTAEGSGANRNENGGTGVDNLLTTDETFGTVHGNSTNRVFTKVRSNLENETTTVEDLDFEGVENGGKCVSLELNINDGTNDGLDGSDGCF
jgi:hypothetical protein